MSQSRAAAPGDAPTRAHGLQRLAPAPRFRTYRWARRAAAHVRDRTRAIEAGDTWWEADLFSGNPDWRKLLDVPAATLTPDERQFIDGPVAQLCAMLDEWDISWNRRDLPPEVWAFLKAQRFFGMIIPRRHGGLGFSPYAHSEVVRRISAYSVTAGVTVMVPNSLGPGELLMQLARRRNATTGCRAWPTGARFPASA